VGGVFISGELRSDRIYLSTPEISLDTKIDQTWQTAKKHRHPETSSGSCTSGHFSIPLLLYFSKAIPESERVLSASVRLPCSTPRAARAPRARQAHQRREDRSKHDRSKHGPRCALGWWRASARGRRRWCSGAAPGEATENSCFPSRKTNLPPVGKSSTFSLCKNATVNGKQLCGKDNKFIIILTAELFSVDRRIFA